MGQAVTTGYAPVSGVSMYWESRGEGGVPLILVHGGYGWIGTFGSLLADLSADRQVIGIELRGHGHTADTGQPFTWAALADDIAALIAHLGLGQADLLGQSLGGIASLRCAIAHPDLVRRLVVVSAPHRRDGWLPEIRAAFDQMSRATLLDVLGPSPVGEAYRAAAPDPGGLPELIDKTGALLREPFDWSAEVRGLALPVLLVYGDADSIPPASAAEFFALLGGGQRDPLPGGPLPVDSRLAILPGITHYSILDAPQLPGIIDGFLR
jgi:pimeloyl-ACP methyl ester carboxylesterase